MADLVQRKNQLGQARKMQVIKMIFRDIGVLGFFEHLTNIQAFKFTIIIFPAPPSLSAKAKLDMAQLRQMGGTSQYKFSVLSKIVRHMRHRHMEGEDQALNLDEILDETNQVGIWRFCTCVHPQRRELYVAWLVLSIVLNYLLSL